MAFRELRRSRTVAVEVTAVQFYREITKHFPTGTINLPRSGTRSPRAAVHPDCSATQQLVASTL
jgi:hypothetical protein